jgi:hypothetical protein
MSTRTDTLGRKLQVDEVTEPQVVSFDIVGTSSASIEKQLQRLLNERTISSNQGAERSCVANFRILRTKKSLKGQACSYRGTKN